MFNFFTIFSLSKKQIQSITCGNSRYMRIIFSELKDSEHPISVKFLSFETHFLSQL